NLSAVQYVNTHPDKFGYAGYKGDFVIRHADGSLELREAKPQAVLARQEEWGRSQKTGWTGNLGWHVLKKAIGVIPQLAMDDIKYSIVSGSDAAKLLEQVPGDISYLTPLPAKTTGGGYTGR